MKSEVFRGVSGRTATVYVGDALTVLRELPAESVHCCVTSPPYWGLRDYGTEPLVWGGDPGCEHEWDRKAYTVIVGRGGHGSGPGSSSTLGGNTVGAVGQQTVSASASCLRCSAWRGSLGLERTPEEYVAALVAVFREVRRVLRDDGTLWLNLGDSYASNGPGSWGSSDKSTLTTGSRRGAWAPGNTIGTTSRREMAGLKPKDLVGVPWRVAFALQTDGWWLRSDIIWHKPNPLPESVTDRPTKAHEYLFLLTKSERYYYDAEAIKEPAGKPRVCGPNSRVNVDRDPAHKTAKQDAIAKRTYTGFNARYFNNPQPIFRNRRSVWTIATHPYREAHFATFPPDLVKPCVLAGCPGGGVVLDPFAGSGTTLAVAVEYKRDAIGVELNSAYVVLIGKRVRAAGVDDPLGLFD